jgi:hypothetical protein
MTPEGWNLAWAELGRALGFEAFETVGHRVQDHRHKSFASSLRDRRGPPQREVTKSHQLVGVRHGVRCILESVGVEDYGELALTVEIAPSLGLCAFIGSPSWIRGLGKSKKVHLGVPALDEELCLEAADPPRLAELLRPQSMEDQQLLEWFIAERLIATDTTVVGRSRAGADRETTLSNVFAPLEARPPAQIAQQLDRLIWFANQLAARRARIQLTPERRQWNAEWQAVASDEQLEFDPGTGALRAALPGASLEVGLETRISALYVEGSFAPMATCLTLRFDQPFGLALHVDEAGLLNAFWELVGKDLAIGHKTFDKAFEVRGKPEAAARAKLLPAASALVEAKQRGWSVRIDDESFFALLPGVASTRAELRSAVELVRQISAALVGPTSGGPYR